VRAGIGREGHEDDVFTAESFNSSAAGDTSGVGEDDDF